MTRDVQHAVKAYRSSIGVVDVAVAEEQLWLAMSRWRDEQVEHTLRRVEQMARAAAAYGLADSVREMIDQRESFEGTFDGEN